MSTQSDFDHIVTTLQNGGVAVVRTDTLYGIVARASDQRAVERVYQIKHRNPEKQCIILVSSSTSVPAYADVVQRYSAEATEPTSVIVPVSTEEFWLTRGGDSIAYRVVRDPFLKKVVETTGPIIAPSANPEGQQPAHSIEQAHSYFNDDVECYIDGGIVPDTIPASTIIKVEPDGTIQQLRGH